jgi:hypothetical protein
MKRTRAVEAESRPQVPVAPAPSPGLAVGDLVLYASHGIGRIESAHPGEGALPERIILAFENGLKVTLRLARAREALRCPPASRNWRTFGARWARMWRRRLSRGRSVAARRRRS